MIEQSLSMPDYPSDERYQNFDRDFIDLMLKLGVPDRLGPTAFALLVYIVRTEDARRFADAPTFWLGSLADRVGIHRNNFKKHLDRCIQSGWLFWCKDKDRETGIGWVLVPMKYQSMLKCSRSVGAENVVQRNVARTIARTIAQDVAQDVARTIARNVAPSSLTLTNPNTSACPSVDPEWVGVVEMLSDAQLARKESAIEAARINGLRPADVVRLVEWWREHFGGFESPSGALYAAIVSTVPNSKTGELPGDLSSCFPRLDPAFVQSLADRRRIAREANVANEAKRIEQQRDAEHSSKKQMLLDWESKYGPKVDALSDDELSIVLNGNQTILEMVRRFGRASPLARFELLRAAAAHWEGGSKSKT